MDFNYNETVRVFDVSRYDGDWMPAKMADAIAWLQEMMAKIPEAHRDSATIEIDSVGSYENSHYASICIEYSRPPTPVEVEARKNSARRQAAQNLEFAKRRLAQEEANIAKIGSGH